MQWPTSDSEFEYVPVSEAEVCCSTGVLMDLDDGRKRECACVRTRLVFPVLLGPTRIVILYQYILSLWGIFLVPMRKAAYKSY